MSRNEETKGPADVYNLPPSTVQLGKLDVQNQAKPSRDLTPRVYFGTQQTLHLKPKLRDALKELYVEALQQEGGERLTPHGFLTQMLQFAVDQAMPSDGPNGK